MPGESRSLPDRPNLRYLRIEAKRRLAVGEFPTLHDAQLAIAREYGEPSWAALKQAIGEANGATEETEPDSPALDQLRWLRDRFSGAGQPGWTAPATGELQEHFSERFLAALPPARLVEAISRMAADLHGEFEVIRQVPLRAQVRLGDLEYMVAIEDDPPHRLAGLRAVPLGGKIRDHREPAPPRTRGEVPAEVPAIAAAALAELGLAALLLAGGAPATNQATDQVGAEPWVLALGWADLDRDEILDPGHLFPAPGVTAMITTTAVLRLVADGRVGLDRPVNDHLRAVRLADDTVTVREVLAHTAGVDSPPARSLYADSVQDLAAVMGPVIACSGPRGVVQPSNGGVAVLGQLVADVTAQPYAEAVTGLVLRPLQMRDSSFPDRPGSVPAGAVTGYALTLDGAFKVLPARVPALQAVAGMWSTGADLVRLGLGWSSLLPESLAHEALTPQAEPAPPESGRTGLGWLLGPDNDSAMIAGAGLDATSYLAVRISDGRTHVVLTSRMIPVNTIADRLRET
jgi:CubicO group peptidase (beta-lactamase class C family)